MAKTVRKFVDPKKVGTLRPAGSTGTRVYAGMKDADWNCNSCGKANIKATTKICPGCGNPKDKSEGYHSPTSERPYLSEQDMADRGIDRKRQKDEECPFCQSALTSKTDVCPNCGGNIENVYKTDRLCPSCKRETNDQVCLACGNETVSKKSLSEQSQYPFPSVDRPIQIRNQKPKNHNLLYGGIGLLVVLFVAVIFMIFRPHDEIATVASNSWTCFVPRQEYQYNTYGDWALPSGADLITSYEKFHHNKQVEAGLKEVCEKKWEVVDSHLEPKTKEVCTEGAYINTTEECDEDTNVCIYTDNYEPDSCEDVPDGTEEVDDYDWVNHCENVMQYIDVPVNQTWYEYNIWEWVMISPLITMGSDNTVVCPVVNETKTIKQAEEDPDITCDTTFLVGKKLYSYQPDCVSEFPLYSVGSNWQLTISGSSITEVNYLP